MGSTAYRTDAVRLRGGAANYGRLEVFQNGTWGTVCDDHFETAEATVACRMLGFRTGEAKEEAHYGRGTGPIWLDELNCRGHESSIYECLHNPIGENDCRHGEDAGVLCSN